MNEIDMVNDAYKKLKSSGIYKHIILEVPFMSRSIDMILVDNYDRIISIEFKLHDWRKAIVQAQDHVLGADESYICIPKRNTESTRMMEMLKDTGIGLMYYDDSAVNSISIIKSYECKMNKWEMWNLSLKNILNDFFDEPIFQNIHDNRLHQTLSN